MRIHVRNSFLRLTCLVISLGIMVGYNAFALELTSPAFQNEGEIPAKYTCDGKNSSPELHWSGAPQGTGSFALTVDDPDAMGGTWVHWVVYNMGHSRHYLPEDIFPTDALVDGGDQGVNSFANIGYGGPCPPSGIHRYVFTLYALDSTLQIPPKASQSQLQKAMKDHTLAQATLLATYHRH